MNRKSYLRCLFVIFMCCFLTKVNAQKPNIRNVYCKIIAYDSLSEHEIIQDFARYRKEYYFNIFNIKAVNYSDDTIFLCIVYNVGREQDKLKNNFSLKKDSLYSIMYSEFEPCNSDFPFIKGCTYSSNLKERVYSPSILSILPKTKKQLNRIIDFFKMDLNLWLSLKKEYKK